MLQPYVGMITHGRAMVGGCVPNIFRRFRSYVVIQYRGMWLNQRWTLMSKSIKMKLSPMHDPIARIDYISNDSA